MVTMLSRTSRGRPSNALAAFIHPAIVAITFAEKASSGVGINEKFWRIVGSRGSVAEASGHLGSSGICRRVYRGRSVKSPTKTYGKGRRETYTVGPDQRQAWF